MDISQLAEATYQAMLVEPDFVVVAHRLLKTSGAERAALIKGVTPEILEKALTYLAAPVNLRERERRLGWLRADPRRVTMLRHYYKSHIVDFIDDWGMTSDPREIAIGKLALIPFKLWPAQRKVLDGLLQDWRDSRPAVLVKGRDVGASWLIVSLLCSLCIFETNFAAGIGSATEVKLDRSGDPDTLMWKAREFMKYLPPEFNAGYEEQKHSHYLRMTFPESGGSLTGEAGDNIGRGGRKSIYAVDESAFIDRPQLVDASLAATTNFRFDVSTPNGINAFFERANNDAIHRYDLTWRDDPRKNQAWYDKKKRELDPVVFAQEIDANFYASAEGVLIPPQWVSGAINLMERKGILPSGAKIAALDVADLGKDRCGFGVAHGNHIETVMTWTGTGTDIHGTVTKAFNLCDMYGVTEMIYDSTGVGAGVRGSARILNEIRVSQGQPVITVIEFVAAGTPLFPDRKVPGTNRLAKDLFLNRAAQGAWYLRSHFQEAYKANEGEDYDPEGIISINPSIPELSRLTAEFSQPTVKETASGKWQIEKTPKGTRSPNMYDVVMMLRAPRKRPMRISDGMISAVEQLAAGD